MTETPAPSHVDLAHELAGSGPPVDLLHGIDPGPDHKRWLQARITGAQGQVWPDHGHYPHLVDPDRFLAAVATFDPSG